MNGRGAIEVTLARERELCRVDVRDEGPGIAPDIHDRVFEPFFTTKARGGGLGLAIARRTAELHGGSIRFDCPPRGGTVMTGGGSGKVGCRRRARSGKTSRRAD